MTKVLLVIGFVVAFCAGLFSGLAVRGREALATSAAVPPAATRPAGPGGPGGLLAAELGLTAEQREQMNRIWGENARTLRHQQDQRRAQFRKEREEAIAALIRPEDRTKYDEVLRVHAQHMTDLEHELRASWQKGVEETRKILTPEQRVKYEEFLKRREAERASAGGSGRDRGDHDQQQQQQNRRADERATSRPGAER
jgi:Spy/CpxP family protein refolding chaperone